MYIGYVGNSLELKKQHKEPIVFTKWGFASGMGYPSGCPGHLNGHQWHCHRKSVNGYEE